MTTVSTAFCWCARDSLARRWQNSSDIADEPFSTGYGDLRRADSPDLKILRVPGALPHWMNGNARPWRGICADRLASLVIPIISGMVSC